MTRLNADNLTCKRGFNTIFSNLSFSLGPGESLLLKGPNGSGKTSLLRILAGFLLPQSGAITFLGADSDLELSEQCHYVGHQNGIKSELNLSENLVFWSNFYGGKQIGDALERMHLQDLHDIPAGLLSAGQKRRLGLARLLVADRPVWLLDEPSVSLDKASTELLARIISEHLERDGLLIAATHIPLGVDFSKSLDLSELAIQTHNVEF